MGAKGLAKRSLWCEIADRQQQRATHRLNRRPHNERSRRLNTNGKGGRDSSTSFSPRPFGGRGRSRQAGPGLRPPKVAYAPELQRRSGSCPQAGEGVPEDPAENTRSYALAAQTLCRSKSAVLSMVNVHRTCAYGDRKPEPPVGTRGNHKLVPAFQ